MSLLVSLHLLYSFNLIITLTIFIFLKYNLNFIFNSSFNYCLKPPQEHFKTTAGHIKTTAVRIQPLQDTSLNNSI